MKIDIVIPVYNNPVGTKKCIDSIYAHIPHVLNKVYVHDNVSEPETIDMLKQLDYPNMDIHFSDENVGFGKAVNRSVAKTSTEFVLMQSSDTVIFDDFLTPMVKIMRDNPNVALLNPNGDTFERRAFDEYDASRGFVQAFNLSGYVFLVRKDLFDTVGGFNKIYGKGYFEDGELARNFIERGNDLGVHADSYVRHEHQGSFKHVPGVNDLFDKNKEIFLERYPAVKERVTFLSQDTTWSQLSEEKKETLTKILRQGGKITWLSKRFTEPLPYLEIKHQSLNLYRFYRQLRQPRKHPDRTYGLLMDDTIGSFKQTWYRSLARKNGLTLL
jgi:N-acetylglucosaminyl-diphospho-decaprenol L-rhamnosyltransferase